MDRQKMTIVTGGCGFIGSNYVRQAIEKGEKVLVFDALTYAGRIENIQEHLSQKVIYQPVFGSLPRRLSIECAECSDSRPAENDKSIEGFFVEKLFTTDQTEDVLTEWLESESQLLFLLADVSNIEVWQTILPYFQTVIHFAAETHVDRSILSAEPFIFSDVHGTFAILDAIRKSSWKGRLLHVSTDEVYGEAKDEPFTEDSPLQPRNPYSVAKTSADRMVASFVHTYGIDAVIVRPSNNFGPHQYPEKLIPLMTIRALLNQPLPVYGDGLQERDWLFVKDSIAGVRAAVEKGRSGEVYNLGGGSPQKNIDVVKKILSLIGRPESLIKHVKDRPGHDRKYWLDFGKAERELGWKPEADFDQALEETVSWYLANKDWWKTVLEADQEFKAFFQAWYQAGA